MISRYFTAKSQTSTGIENYSYDLPQEFYFLPLSEEEKNELKIIQKFCDRVGIKVIYEKNILKEINNG